MPGIKYQRCQDRAGITAKQHRTVLIQGHNMLRFFQQVLQLVFHQNDGLTLFLTEVFQNCENIPGALGIQISGWLIQNNDLRIHS